MPISSPTTISEMLSHTVRERADEAALGFIRAGELRWLTWQQVADDAARLAAVLHTAGIRPGDRVAHVSENRYEWIITDLAMHLAGAVHVPIHVTLSGQQIAEQIVDCEARVVFVSSDALLAKFAKRLPDDVNCLIHDEQSERRERSLPDKPTTSQPPTPSPQPPIADAIATILYTSGTTGRPRGVMLSHRNLAVNAAATADAFSDDQCETRLCILPLSHIFARTCDMYTWVYRGSRLVIAESRETLHRDCQLAHPTALNAVPYVYQKIADRLQIGDAADQTNRLREFFGGRISLLNSGGAPLAPSVEQWYSERGLPILPGYGLTETSPVVSISTPERNRFGSVGQALPRVELRIADDGELLVRGPSVMCGYWRDEAATNEAIRGGWFHTGDLAELDAEGFLYIRGRKKELIVLATGKKVSPTRVESVLTSSPLIEQAAVFGEGHSSLAALIVPSACGLDDCSQEQLRDRYAAEIERCLQSAAHEEQVRRFALLDRPFSIEQGELTAKMSLCRNVIARNFAAELEQLDANASNKSASQATRLTV